MIVRLTLFLMMAIGLGGFGTVAWVSTRPAHVARVAAPVPTTETILVAAHPLQAGSLLRPEDLESRTMLKTDVGLDANLDIPAVRGGLMGAMMRRSLGASEIIRSSDVMRPGDHGFLAAVLGAGKLAVTVGVDAVSGTAGLIWPGDRVDLILTEQPDNNHPQISATRVLSDARVIAIDQHLVEGVNANSNLTQPVARTVTLEVNSVDAERVAVATRLGTLSLAVRAATPAAAGHEAPRASTVVWSSDILPPQPVRQRAAALSVRVWQGTGEAREFHF